MDKEVNDAIILIATESARERDNVRSNQVEQDYN